VTIDIPVNVIGKFCMSCPRFEFLDVKICGNDLFEERIYKCAHYDQCKRVIDGYLREHPQEKHSAK